MKYLLTIPLILCSYSIWAQQANSPQEDYKKAIAIKLADEQLQGYNNRDIEAFLAPYSEDVEVYTFPDILRYKGKNTMREHYAERFNNVTDLHCTITNRVVHGNYVIDQEEVLANGRIIHAVAIYLIENDKIAKVYFLPR